ncbi:MAG: 3-hydroxyacyl-CoA dehydrogenase family protein [Polyangiaceae bacterium]|nr:3-hydroxyacyl-CoA dehydrogenase family protein [Polyangiaceae bacterium]
MGQGIAQVCAAAGMEARLFDVDPAKVDGALASIAKAVARMVEKNKIKEADKDALLAKLVRTSSLEEGSKGIDLCIEAVPEKMDLKVEVLSKVVAAAPSHAIVGSNTSSLSITQLGTRLGVGDRTVGLHFFNPPPVMELLEIVRGGETTDATLESSLAVAKRLGKTPIVVKDSPGFATSRLGVALGCEAIRMLEAGVASVQDIDRAMELGYRHPMGPLKLGDLVGLDVRLGILEHLHKEIGEQFRPPELLRKMVRDGKLGKKTGEGFYRWTADGPVPAS